MCRIMRLSILLVTLIYVLRLTPPIFWHLLYKDLYIVVIQGWNIQINNTLQALFDVTFSSYLSTKRIEIELEFE